MQPRVAIGHDVVLASTEPIYQTPRNAIARPVERNYGLGGSVHDRGLFVCFHFDMVDGEAVYISILNQFGLLGEDSSEVTVYIFSPRMAPTLYNGIAFLPQAGEDFKLENFFPRNIELYVTDLEEFS